MSQKKKSKEREEDFKKSQVGELILQRQALEENLRHLSDEVETLSHKNQRLLKDLKVKDFYQQYNQLREELETIQKAHATLISTLQPDKFAKKSIRDPNQLSKQTPNHSHSTDQPKRLLDSQRQYHGDHHGYHNQSQQRQNSSSGSSVDAILKFFSCNGCGIGPNSTGLNHASNFNINHSIIDRSNYQYQYMGPVVGLDGKGSNEELDLKQINFLYQKSVPPSRSRSKNTSQFMPSSSNSSHPNHQLK
eukprot:403365454